MANGTFYLSTSNPYVKGWVKWSSTSNNNGNYSDVYVEMQFWRTNTGYTTYGSGTFGIYVDGQPVERTTSFTITNTQNPIVVSGWVKVNHSADGTKAITIGGDGNTNVFDVYPNSTTAYLDNIPRASTITSNVSWTAAIEGLPVSLNRASGSFHHSLELMIKNPSNGNWSNVCYRYNVGDSTTIYFDKTEMTKIYTQMAQWENAEVWLKAETWNGGTLVGITEKYGKVYGATPATPIVSDFDIGTTSVGQTLDYWYDTFTYELTFTLGSFVKKFPNVTKYTPMEFTSADFTEMYKQITTSNSRQATVYASTKYNGVELNDGVPKSQTTTINVRVTNSNPTYDGGFTYADTNATTKGITGNDQYIVQGKSTLQVKIPATKKAVAVNNATMSKYDVTVNGVTKSVNYATTDITVDFGTVSASSNVTATVTAVDSRGNKTPASSVILILPYSPPNISTGADRLNNFEASTTIKLSGNYSPLTIGSVSKNKIASAKFQKRQVGGAYDTPGTTFTVTETAPNFVATDATVSLDNTLAWEILFTVTDQLGSTTTTTRTVAVGTPIFFIDTEKSTVGVNKFPTSSANGLEIVGDLDVDGIIKAKADQWISSGKVGLDMRNSDMKGLNAIYFNDDSGASDEGINFLRTGKAVGSATIADYDNFSIVDGGVRLNNRNLFWQEGGQASNNIRLAGDMYSQTTGGVIFDVWGNIKGQPTAVDYNTWSIQDADGKIRFLCGIGKGSTSATEIKAYTGGIRLVQDDRLVAAFWQQGQGASSIMQLGAGILQYYNNWFEFKGPGNSGWGNVYGNWVAPSSASYKKDITVFDDSALSYVNAVKPVLYQYKEQDKSEPYTLGLIAEESPSLIQGANGKGIKPYSMMTMLWKAVQELDCKVENLNERINRR